MSLINDALKDLDARQVGETAQPQVTAEKNTVFKGNYTPLLFAFLLFAAAAVFYLGTLNRGDGSADSGQDSLVHDNNSHQQTEPLPTAHGEKTPVAILAEAAKENVDNPKGQAVSLNGATGMSDQPSDLSSPVDMQQTNKQSELEYWLQQAELAFSRNRLTLPEKQSAWYFYQKILEQDADVTAARQGVEKIQLRYEQLLNSAVAENNIERLSHLLSRVDRVQLQLGNVDTYRNQLLSLKQAADRALAREAPADESRNLGVAALKPSVNIAKTLPTQDRELASQQTRAYNAGQQIAAREKLEGFVSVHPNAVQSLLALFDIHLRENANAKAASLQAKTFRGSVLHDYLGARLLVVQQKFQAAQSILASHPYSELQSLFHAGQMEQNLFERYNGLLAALYQQHKQHLLAAERYQMLVGVDVKNTQYWMGYAISSDSLGHKKNALRAYEQVLKIGDTSEQMVTYASARLQVLSKELQQTIAGASVSQ